MNLNGRIALIFSAATALTALTVPLLAQSPFSDNTVRIVVMNDQTGYGAAQSGVNSVKAAQLAAADFAKANPKFPKIEITTIDHQAKPDIASAKAGEAFDRQGADLIVDLPTSSAALAVADIAKQKKKMVIVVTGGTSALTNEKCNRYTFHYAYDNYALANGSGTYLTKKGLKNWYIIYPNYAFGQDLERQMRASIVENGGKLVAPSEATPFPNDDYSSYLLKAQGLKPQVVGLMTSGTDLVNAVKQFNEFKLRDSGIQLALGLLTDPEIKALGPDAFAGAVVVEPWFWNLDAISRAWSNRFEAAVGAKPTFPNAGVYSAVTQYLNTVKRAGTDDATKVVSAFEGSKFSDFFARNASVRKEDHRVLLDVYLTRVKAAKDVTTPGDYYTRLETIPAAKAFTPLAESKCKMEP